MNKKEIDKMMQDLPSQQPRETLASKIIVAIIFFAIIIAMCWVPDFEPEQPIKMKVNHGNI